MAASASGVSAAWPAGAALRLCLLGVPRLEWPRGRVHLLQRRDAALLALVVLEGPLPRSRAAARVWPDADSEGARNNLRQRLFRLRRSAERDVVSPDDLLQLGEGITHDLGELEARLSADPQAAHGELLGDLDFADCAELADWVDTARERWRSQRAQALSDIASRLESERDIGLALRYAQRLLDADPLVEAAHRHLMRLHYLRGDRDSALAVHARLRELLHTELRAEPDPQTRALAELIDRAASSPAHAAARPLPPAVLRPPRLVGREAEWRALDSAWHEGAAVLVSGEAGIGKSRLLGDFALAHGAHSIASARPGDTQVPYASLARLLRSLPAQPCLAAWARAEIARLLPEWGESAAGRLDPLHLRAALASWLDAAAASGPFSVVLDDLQFADAATLEVLPALVADCSGPRWLFGSRPAAGANGAMAAGGIAAPAAPAALDAAPVLRLELAPLDVAGVRSLVESLELPGIAAESWAPALWRHSGGNPLFLLETLRTLLRDEAVPALHNLPTPAPLARLIEQRLDQLSPSALRLARLAALAGSDFDIELAAAVLGQHAIDLADPWRELADAHIVRDAGFAHDLVLDATRGAVPAAVAQLLHAQIAAQLAQRGVAAARVATHWQAAQRWREAGAAFDAAAREALAASRRSEELLQRRQAIAAWAAAGDAGQAFRARVDSLEALLLIESVEQAQAMADGLLQDAAGPSQRLDAQLARAQTLLMAARQAEAMDAAAEARELAGRLKDVPRERVAARYLAVGLAQAQRADEAVSLLEPYQAGLADDPGADEVYRFWSDFAYVLQLAQQRSRCADALERAIAGGQARGDFAEVMTNLSNLAGVKFNLGRVDAALVDAERARAMIERLGEVGGVPAASLEIHLGLLRAATGALGPALAHFNAACDLAARAGHGTWVMVAQNHRATTLLQIGQTARARQALPADDPAALTGVRARSLIIASRIERALEHSPLPLLERALVLLGDSGDPYTRLQAQIDSLRAQDGAQAALLGAALESSARRIEHLALACKARWYRVDALRRAGALDEALALANVALRAQSETQASDMYPPEAWWIAHQAFSAAGDRAASAAVLRTAVAWIEAAAADIPPEFVDSFRQRNPVNRALLTLRTG